MINNISLTLIYFLILSFLSCQKAPDLDVNSKEELQEKLKIEVKSKNLHSISYCVVKNDKILYSNALGFADKSNSKLATDSTRYLIASISKTITAVALMQLVEQSAP